MLLMGFVTILYEIERNDYISLVIISFILVGIYGLICIDENNIIHYFFAFIVFISILLFMIWHSRETDIILLASLFLELLLMAFIIIHINENIFYSEILYILNFAFYYLYLHFSPLSITNRMTYEENINNIEVS
jgi:hypothetical protein